jgi:riboflavin biosynthesis pyrimidine reductase
MILQKLPDSEKVTQIFPKKRQMRLEGLYLDQRLAELSVMIGRPLVLTDFLTDRQGIIAKADEQHHFQVPPEIKNTSDWRLAQELMAQADVIISGAAYVKRVSALGSRAQNILSQFEPGRGFEKLGEWRLRAGYQRRSPDLAVVTRSLDFEFPKEVTSSGRKILIFTTTAMANSDKAKAWNNLGMVVIGSGELGVDGNGLIDTLSNETGYRVIMMATGPRVLELLLAAKRLDLFYVTEAQRDIQFEAASTVKTILPEGQKVNQLKEFSVGYQYLQENVVTEDGSRISQFFLRYDRKGIFVDAPRAQPEADDKRQS